ncbi:hypothetical protein F5887DRAFT_1084334 [Amanita rubescens]|nr:hypothetical protein F5887DRAFT_1084334 [Amanita rubescens]
MAPVDLSALEKKLLRNRIVDALLGPFDGRVAALYPNNPELYISSPNYDAIFLPPGPACNVYARYDGRYGHDDHTQWPQPFSSKYLHLCCIPRSGDGQEHSVIWQNPVRDDFIRFNRDGMVIELGKWSEHWLQQMGTSCRWLFDEVTRRRSTNQLLDTHPLLPPLLIHLERAINRLRAVAMSYREAVMSLRLTQRLWLELHALMDYVHTYLPFMEGRVPRAAQVAPVIGCFVRQAHVAEQLFAAGIPYWLVREVQTFDRENILMLDAVIPPEHLVQLDEFSPHTHCIYQGDSNDNRYRAIYNHSLRYLCWANPFSAAQPRGITPFESSRSSLSGLSRQVTGRSHTKSAQPYSKRPGGQSSGRNKFEVVSSPYMPLCLDAWRKALLLAGQNSATWPLEKKKSPNDGRYAFPEPGLFCYSDNLVRQNRYLTVWDHLHLAIINRMSSDMGQIDLFSSQQWRTLLGAHPSSEKTRTEALRISLNDLLSSDAAEAGVDLSRIHEASVKQYSVSEAQTVLWELSELGFRYELVMLDRRAIEPRVIEDQRYKDSLLSPLKRETHILRCFPFGPSEPRHLAYVPINHASRGLASPAVRDRLPYLTALRYLMGEWDGYEKSELGRLQTPTQNSRDRDLYYYEESIAQFYVQMFFRFFGRAAIIPMYLTHT